MSSYNTLLILHILSGSLGILTGTINLSRHKGDKTHRLVGKVFAWSMLITGLSALILSMINPNTFLFIVGVFTIYMVATGYRYLYLKKLGISQKPGIIDWLILGSMILAILAFVFLGVQLLIQGQTFGIVHLVFAGLSTLFVFRDYQNFSNQPSNKNFWLLAHLQRMTGAYIASTTAFLVVNAHYIPIQLPEFVYWLIPTVVLTPLINRWSTKYER